MFKREQSRQIGELEDQLEMERIRREKLESQLDNCRQELEKTITNLREFETKVIVLERYIQLTSKQNNKAAKKAAKESQVGSNTPKTTIPRSKSQTKLKNREDSSSRTSFNERKIIKNLDSEKYVKNRYDILDVSYMFIIILFLNKILLILDFNKFTIERTSSSF